MNENLSDQAATQEADPGAEWARVELMGHRQRVGQIQEVTRFGIRKSLAGYEVVCSFSSAALPLPYRGFEATHFLSHSGGDDILFDSRFPTPSGGYWKLRDESGDWCSCSRRGEPELACEVHHFYVVDQDVQCACQERLSDGS